MRPAFFVITSIAAVLIGLFVGRATTSPGFTRQDISDIVETTLVEKPEILMRAAQALQASQAEQQQQQGQLAAVQLQAVIFDGDSPAMGDAEASMVIAEFFDYQCGHCQTMSARMKGFTEKHRNVRVIYKELPIFGGESLLAARAALAANEQGQYYPMHEALMKLGKARNLTEETILSAATELGLDVTKLQADMESKTVEAELGENKQLAQSLGFRGTPAFVVRSPATDMKPELIFGAVPLSELERYTGD